MFKLIIDEINSNICISKFLDKFSFSLQRKKQLSSINAISVNRVTADLNYILKQNDLLEIDLSIFPIKKYRPVEFNLTILYEDEYIIAVDKPSGYIIYDVDDKKDSICNFLSYYYKKYKKNCDIIPIHRLDTDTSGCIIFAKDIITSAYFSKIFEKNEITKKYVALVSGSVEKEGCINKNIGRDRHVNGKMIVCERGKLAITKYRLLKSNERRSLVEAIPITGRTHQVRVHLASIGNPLIGDKLYGSKVLNNRVMLHCQAISFIHPIKEKAFTIFSPTPEDFKIE